MILSDHFKSLEIFELVHKLEKEDLSEDGRKTLEQLEQKLLLFKCPSCDTPIGLAINKAAWEAAYLKDWSTKLTCTLDQLLDGVYGK